MVTRPAARSHRRAVWRLRRLARPLFTFMSDRLAYLLEQRGFDVRSVRAVMHAGIEHVSPLEARRKLEALQPHDRLARSLLGVATLFKRVKNITKRALDRRPRIAIEAAAVVTDPAEQALRGARDDGARDSRRGGEGDYREAFTAIAALQPRWRSSFDDVLVMAEDAGCRRRVSDWSRHCAT